jgi:hypothetical protein
VDIFKAARIEQPDISILSEQFLGKMRNMPQMNLAIKVLKKLLTGEINAGSRMNVVQSRSLAELFDLLYDSMLLRDDLHGKIYVAIEACGMKFININDATGSALEKHLEISLPEYLITGSQQAT